MHLHNFGLPFCLNLVVVLYEGHVFEGMHVPVLIARAGVRPLCGFMVDPCSLPETAGARLDPDNAHIHADQTTLLQRRLHLL